MNLKKVAKQFVNKSDLLTNLVVIIVLAASILPFIYYGENSIVTVHDNLDISVLSKNELQVLQLFADGLSIKDISRELIMTVKTVEKHKSNMMAKLNIKSNIELIKFAIKNNVCYL